MFAVSHKPTTLGRFIVKQEKKTLKDTKTPKQAKQANESNEVKIFKTKVITAPIPEKTNVVTVNEAIVDKKTEAEQNKEVKPIKRLKFKLSVVRDIPYQPNTEKKVMKRIKDSKQKQKRSNREGNFNCGRWQQEEHQRFIEAILKYGNEWKQVQKHVGTRSSTQARSHAQKFFVKMKKSNILDLDIDLSKNSIKTLHDLANSMNSDEYINAIKALNCIAFERKNISKKKQRKEELGANMSESDIFANEINSTVNFGYVECFKF